MPANGRCDLIRRLKVKKNGSAGRNEDEFSLVLTYKQSSQKSSAAFCRMTE